MPHSEASSALGWCRLEEAASRALEDGLVGMRRAEGCGRTRWRARGEDSEAIQLSRASTVGGVNVRGIGLAGQRSRW